jgi:hypothetical protein
MPSPFHYSDLTAFRLLPVLSSRTQAERRVLRTPASRFGRQLVVDESGKRLAKRHGALSLRALRERGAVPEELRARYENKS